MNQIIEPVPTLTQPVFDLVQDLLEKAIAASHDDITMRYVTDSIVSGKSILWTISIEECRGIIVTTIIPLGKGTALLIWLMAGEAIVLHAEKIQKKLDQFAYDSGCTEIKTIVSNKKLENYMLGNLGYQLGGTVLYKEITKHERTISERTN